MPECLVCQSDYVTQVYQPEISSGNQLAFSYTFSPAHNRTFAVYECDDCTHQFCSPIPTDIGVNYKNVVDQEYLKHEMSRKFAARRLLKTLANYQRPGRLVDIGCATGDFLQEAEIAGYECEGVEPCSWSAKIARERGFEVHPELLEQFAAKYPGRYDVATLWGVIEHFENPVAEVRRLNEILKPGGLFLIWTGDVDSVTSRLLGKKWWYWQGQHIQYFTQRSLERLLERNGFDIVTTKLYPFAASYDTLDNSLKRYKNHGLFTTLLKPLFAIKPIWYLYLPGEMFVIARKRA
jgi:SAM-dependent methyltransferase